MNRSKNPFNQELFSKIYTCTFKEEKSGYEISMQIYSHDKKSYYILEIIRKNPDYFHEIQHENDKHPKYKAKVTPLVNMILKNATIDTNTKRKLINTIKRKDFRKYIKYNETVRNHRDIITFISFLAGSYYVYRHYLKEKIDALKINNFDMTAAQNITNKVDYQFKETTSITDKLHSKDFLELGIKTRETFLNLSDKTLTHIINQSPLAALVPQTTLTMLFVNDLLNEYITEAKTLE